MQIWKYDAGLFNGRPYAEILDTIPVTKKNQSYVEVMPLASQVGAAAGGVKAGDVFMIVSELEVTTAKTYNVMLSGILRVGQTFVPQEGIEIGKYNGQNFNMEEHHFTLRKSGMWVSTLDAPSLIFKLQVHSASDAAAAGDSLLVNQNYGFMHVLQIRDTSAKLAGIENSLNAISARLAALEAA